MTFKLTAFTLILASIYLALFHRWSSTSPSRLFATREQHRYDDQQLVTDDFALNLSFRAPPLPEVADYKIEDYINLHQFENAKITWNQGTPQEVTISQVDNYRDMVKITIVTAIKMLNYPVGHIWAQTKKPIPDSVSFLRYFRQSKQDALQVTALLLNIAAGLGHPNARACDGSLPKLDVYYGDPPADVYQDNNEPGCIPFREDGN